VRVRATADSGISAHLKFARFCVGLPMVWFPPGALVLDFARVSDRTQYTD
jgi:hypothetical protein